MKLLALDLSTSATGYAVFESDKLTSYGVLTPKIVGVSKLRYPIKPLYAILDISEKVIRLIQSEKPDAIVIEEVNRGISRISQKSLDALHFFILDLILKVNEPLLQEVEYMDSNGPKGWRPCLGIQLSDEDKLLNAKIRKEAKRSKVKSPAVVNWKTLAVRYVNAKYSLNLSGDLDPGTDGDIADAVALGTAYLTKLK